MAAVVSVVDAEEQEEEATGDEQETWVAAVLVVAAVAVVVGPSTHQTHTVLCVWWLGRKRSPSEG